jgi:hypothetical protein
LSLWELGVVYVFVIGVSGRVCVLMDEMGCFELWFDVIRVYVVGVDGHVSSCLNGLFFRRSVVGSLAMILFAILH